MTREEEIMRKASIACLSDFSGCEVGTYHKAFTAGAKWADANPMNGWCSVKDELPKPNGEVLADIVNTVGDEIYHEHAIAYFNKDKGQWFTVDGEAVNVVNWMPLPELPKND
jgi:hypothetical protein